MIRFLLALEIALLVQIGAATSQAAPDTLRASPDSLRRAPRLPRVGLAPDQALYLKEYVRRRAFPDTILDFIPAIELRRTLRFPLYPLPTQPAVVPCQWTHAGPTNVPGRVTGIAVTRQPSVPGTPRVIVTTVGGVWRSMDGARRWSRVSAGMKPGVFGSIAVTPNASNEVFVGGGDPNYRDPARAGGPGIWVSDSGGDPGSWRQVGPPELEGAVIFRIQIAPTSPHDVYVATSKGVYRGDRSGVAIAWSRLQGSHANGFDAPTSDIAVDFTAGGSPIVCAGAYESSSHFGPGIWKFVGSPATGTWAKRSDGISTHAGVIHLAIAESKPATLFAKITDKTDSSLLGIYKTITGGESPATNCASQTQSCTWCNIKTNLVDDSEAGGAKYDDYNGAIAIHPTNPDVVFVGNLKLFWTNTGCAPWYDFSHGLEPPRVGIHDDQHALAFDPEDPNVLWVGGDGGVFRGTFIDDPAGLGVGIKRWEARAHGITTTEFWGIGTQQAKVTPLLGGMQDNGTGVTYGNRTWYARYTCDGSQAWLDAANSATVYESCNGDLEALRTIIPMIAAWQEVPHATDWPDPRSPLAADVALPGHLLDAGVTMNDTACIATSTDARSWQQTAAVIPSGMEVSCVAIAPPTDPGCGTSIATPFSNFYVGLRSTDPKAPKATVIFWHGSGSWQEAVSGVPVLSPNSIAVDRCDAYRAFAAFGGDRGQTGKVCVTTDGGLNWHELPFPSDAPQAPATGVAIDPFDRNVIYAATAIGVFRGTVTFAATPTCDWVNFSQGLPVNLTGTISVDATSIDVNAKTGTLVLGTMGYGAFQRDIRRDHVCEATVLSIRDNVFDRGEEPSPAGEPDPEHPICVDSSCETYKPNDAVTLQWWNSPDIRVGLPCPNSITGCICTPDEKEPTGDPPDGAFDAVEVESCPTETSNCPAGLMQDRRPKRGCLNRVYVQVTNRGTRTGRNLRVVALWTDAAVGLPILPSTFWTTNFPATGTCQPLPAGSSWHSLDPANPCKTIAAVEPDRPEVVYFDWKVPANAPAHSCILALVDSPDDPIPASVRSNLSPWLFVRNTHQIGQRNLHIFDLQARRTIFTALDSLIFFNPSLPMGGGRSLVISRAQLEKGDLVGLLLPKTTSLTLVNVDTTRVRMTPDQISGAVGLGVDTAFVYRVRQPGGRIENLPIPPDSVWRVGLLVRTAGTNRKLLAPRFTVIAKSDTVILGGSTYVLRFRK